jgi:hypothetical protein
MSTAPFSAQSRSRGLVARTLAPLVDLRAYLRAIHLLVMFPLGLAYFIFFAFTLSFGGALVWTFIGPPILLLAMFVSLRIGDAEVSIVNYVTQSDIRRPPMALEGVTSFRERVWARIIDPSTWTGLVYAIVQFPVGIAGFVLVVTTFSVAFALIASPLLVALGDGSIEIGDSSSFVLDSPLEALALIPLGLLTWLLTMHVVVACSALHAMWARLMLGSRGRRPTSEPGQTVESAGPQPPLLLPTAEQPTEPDETSAETRSGAGIKHPLLG